MHILVAVNTHKNIGKHICGFGAYLYTTHIRRKKSLFIFGKCLYVVYVAVLMLRWCTDSGGVLQAPPTVGTDV